MSELLEMLVIVMMLIDLVGLQMVTGTCSHGVLCTLYAVRCTEYGGVLCTFEVFLA